MKKPTVDRISSFLLIGVVGMHIVSAVVDVDAGEYYTAALKIIISGFAFGCLLQQDLIFTLKALVEALKDDHR